MTTASQKGSRPVEALDYDFNLSKLEHVMSGAGKVDAPHSLKDLGVSRNEIQQIVPAVLHEVKERAVVDKTITEAEVVALLEASHGLPTKR